MPLTSSVRSLDHVRYKAPRFFNGDFRAVSAQCAGSGGTSDSIDITVLQRYQLYVSVSLRFSQDRFAVFQWFGVLRCQCALMSEGHLKRQREVRRNFAVAGITVV